MARRTQTDQARPRRGLTAAGVAAACAALTGCGSAAVAELPPAVGPDPSPPTTTEPAGTVHSANAVGSSHAFNPKPTEATLRDGSLRVVVRGRARVLELYDVSSGRRVAEADAGVGPTNVVCAEQGPCFVTDTQGDALLVFRVGADGQSLRLTRRVYVAGAPFGIAIDRERRRLWVTMTARNELGEYGAHGRPHLLQRLPTVRQPNRVAVDERTGDVTIEGEAGDVRQVLDDPASPDR